MTGNPQNPDRGPPKNLSEEIQSAVQKGDLGELRVLLERWKREIQPFALSAFFQWLTNQCPTKDLPPDDLEVVLRWAIQSENRSTAMLAYLLDQGSKFDTSTLMTAFFEPEPSTEIFQLFIDRGWDINQPARITNSTLLGSTIHDLRMVEWCLSHGADPDLTYSRNGLTLLDWAAELSSPEVIRVLIKSGADLSQSNALHSAVHVDRDDENDVERSQQVMACLLDEFGMDINARATYLNRPPRGGRNMNGTPLHEAMQAENVCAIRYLLERGADRRHGDALGQSAQYYAEEYCSEEIKSLLRWPF